MISVRLANKNDCRLVSEIHFQEIKWGFLPQLGKKFLNYFYEAMTDSQNAFLIIAQNDNFVIGFVSGCTNLKKFYQEFIGKYKFKAFFTILERIIDPGVIKKMFETIRYSQRKEKDLPRAELLSIAVLESFRGRGVAQKLLENFIAEMKKKNVNQFKVIVGESLTRAIAFYEENGFIFHSRDYVHEDTPSRIYLYNI